MIDLNRSPLLHPSLNPKMSPPGSPLAVPPPALQDKTTENCIQHEGRFLPPEANITHHALY
jgi:hypothetical protein